MKRGSDPEMMVIEVREVFFNNSFAKNFSEYLTPLYPNFSGPL